MDWRSSVIAFGAAALVAGLAGVAIASGTDSTCFGSADRDASGNWVSGSYGCNTEECPTTPTTACTQQNIGASKLHPGYNATICRCEGQSGILCELVWYEKDNDPADTFAGCPDNPCTGDDECELDPAAGAGSKTCSCQ